MVNQLTEAEYRTLAAQSDLHARGAAINLVHWRFLKAMRSARRWAEVEKRIRGLSGWSVDAG